MNKNFQKVFHIGLCLCAMIAVSLINISCKDNELEDRAGVTNESLLVDAEKLMNDQLWDEAISKFGEMDVSFRESRENVISYASAHAGRCGLSLVDLTDAIDDQGSVTPMQLMMSIMESSTDVEMAHCIIAESILEANASDDASLRTADENLLFTLVMVGKIGSILSSQADPDGDGVANLAHNGSCAVNPIDDTEVGHIGTGLNKMLLTIPHLVNVDLVGDIDDELQQVCDSIEGFNPAYNFCSITDPSDFTADHIRGIRSIIQEGVTFGLSTCVPPNPPFPVGSPPNLGFCVCP